MERKSIPATYQIRFHWRGDFHQLTVEDSHMDEARAWYHAAKRVGLIITTHDGYTLSYHTIRNLALRNGLSGVLFTPSNKSKPSA